MSGIGIIVDGREMPYDHVRKFDGIVLDLGYKNPEWRGSYFTGFSVSPLEYRKQNPTCASVDITHEPSGAVTFRIRSDFGGVYSSAVTLPAVLKDEIETAIAAIRANGLLPEGT